MLAARWTPAMLGWPRLTLQHRSRCIRRLRTPLVMWLGLAISLSAALAQDEPILGALRVGLMSKDRLIFRFGESSRSAPTRVLMLIAMRWIQRELKLAMLPTKSSAGPRFLMQK